MCEHDWEIIDYRRLKKCRLCGKSLTASEDYRTHAKKSREIIKQYVEKHASIN